MDIINDFTQDEVSFLLDIVHDYYAKDDSVEPLIEKLWKIDGWELPNAVTCIIRAEGKDGKITEHTYQTQGHAKRKIEQLVKNRQSFVVCDNDAIQNMRTPQ